MPKPPTPKKKLRRVDAYFDKGKPLMGTEKVSGEFADARVALIVEEGMTWEQLRPILVEIRKQFK